MFSNEKGEKNDCGNGWNWVKCFVIFDSWHHGHRTMVPAPPTTSGCSSLERSHRRRGPGHPKGWTPNGSAKWSVVGGRWCLVKPGLARIILKGCAQCAADESKAAQTQPSIVPAT